MNKIGDMPEMVRLPPSLVEAEKTAKASGHVFTKIGIVTGVTAAVALLGVAVLGTLAMPALAVITVPVFVIGAGSLALAAVGLGGIALAIVAKKVMDAVRGHFQHTSPVSQTLNNMLQVSAEKTKVPIHNSHTILATEFDVPSKVEGELAALDRLTIGNKEQTLSLPSTLNALHELCDGNDQAAIALTSLINPTHHENNLVQTAFEKKGDTIQVSYTRQDGTRLALNVPLSELAAGEFKNATADVLEPVLPPRLLSQFFGPSFKANTQDDINVALKTAAQKEAFLQIFQDIRHLEDAVYLKAKTGSMLKNNDVQEAITSISERVAQLSLSIEGDEVSAHFQVQFIKVMQHAFLAGSNTQIVTDHILRAFYPDEVMGSGMVQSQAQRMFDTSRGNFESAMAVDLSRVTDPKEKYETTQKLNGYHIDGHFNILARGTWTPDANGAPLNRDGTRNFVKGEFALDVAFFDPKTNKPVEDTLKFAVDVTPFIQVTRSPAKAHEMWNLIWSAADKGLSAELFAASPGTPAGKLRAPGVSEEQLRQIAQVGADFRESMASQLSVFMYEQSYRV